MSSEPDATAAPRGERSGEDAPGPSEPPPARRWYVGRHDLVVLAATVALATAGIALLVVGYLWESVWLVNGLDVPVRIEVDGETVEVAARSRERRDLHIGVHEITARSEQRVLERVWIDVRRYSGTAVYNVLGAAPLYTATLQYSSSPGNEEPKMDFLGGRPLTVTGRVDFPFRPPDQEIKIKQGERNTRVQMEVVEGGWTATVGYFMSQGQVARAGRLARAVASAEPGHASVRNIGMVVSLGEGAHATARLDRVARDAEPGNHDAHLGYQQSMLAAGLLAPLMAEYRDREQKAPDSSMEAVMRARLEPVEQRMASLDELMKRFPTDALVRRSAAIVALRRDDTKTAADLFDQVASAPGHVDWLDSHAHALVAVGRVADAFALLDRASPAAPDEELRVLLTRARVGELTGTAVTRREATSPGAAALISSLLGEKATAPADMSGMQATLDIHAAALTDPGRAGELCAPASPFALSQVHPVVAFLVALELERTGDPVLARRVASLGARTLVDREVILARLFDGTEHADLTRLDPEMRAALDFARSRVLMESGDVRGAEAARLAAKKRDVLRGPVSRAMAAWPAPDPTAEKRVMLAHTPRN